MNRSMRIAGLLLLLAGLGCEKSESAVGGYGPTNRQIMSALKRTQVTQAIIVQLTLFPYHFLTGSADLNALGERDLSVMASHLRKHAGPLNVRRGNVSPELHQARMATVRQTLRQSDVDPQTVTLVDGRPGGEGMTSKDVRAALERTRDSQTDAPAAPVIEARPTGADPS